MCAPLTVPRRSCGIRKHTSRSFRTLFNDAHNKCSTKRNISRESAFNERRQENPLKIQLDDHVLPVSSVSSFVGKWVFTNLSSISRGKDGEWLKSPVAFRDFIWRTWIRFKLIGGAVDLMGIKKIHSSTGTNSTCGQISLGTNCKEKCVHDCKNLRFCCQFLMT